MLSDQETQRERERKGGRERERGRKGEKERKSLSYLTDEIQRA